jgi:hypothetical protein
MRRRVLLATALLVLVAAGGFAWRGDRASFDCLEKAQSAELTVHFEVLPGASRADLRLVISDGGSEVFRSREAEPFVRGDASGGKAMAARLLEPLSQPVHAEPMVVSSELTLRLRCDGGRQHVRHLISTPRLGPLSDCWPDARVHSYRAPSWGDALECAQAWFRVERPWTFGERDERAPIVGYRAWDIIHRMAERDP